MKTIVKSMMLFLAVSAGAALAANKTCTFSDTAKMKEHLTSHVTYPATGKEVKAVCKKEIPDEFPKEERACFESKLKDTAKFTSAEEVMAAVGVK